MEEQAYAGFDLIPDTETDGWIFGAITVYGEDSCDCPPGGCIAGDGFVQAPDGTRAGIIWAVEDFEPIVQGGPDSTRWGVFEVPFPHPVATTADLVSCFESILPYLREQHAQWVRNASSPQASDLPQKSTS